MTSDYLPFLLSMITEAPDDYASQDETFKYPFIASQFFCSQFSKLTERILEEPKHFAFLLKFLETPEPLPVLAGYFSRTCEVLLESFPEKFLFEFCKCEGHLKLVQQVKNSSLAELLGKILVKICRFDEFLEEFHQCLNEICKKLEDVDEVCCFNVVAVLKKLGDLKNFEISGFWVGFMKKNLALEQSCGAFKRFLMGNDQFLKRVLNGVRSQNKVLSTACLKIFLDVLMIVDKETEEINWAFRVFLADFETFVGVLRDLNMSQEFLNALEIFQFLFYTNNEEIGLKIAEAGVLDQILKSLERFPFCTFLHNLFSSIFSCIFNSNMQKVKDFVLKDLNFIEFILKNTENPLILWKKCEIRKGFIPHLFFLANLLESLKKTDFFLHQTLKSHQNWKKFTRSTLQRQNCIESKSLGGEGFENFFEKSSDEDSETSKDLPDTNEFNDVEFWRVPLPDILEDL